jgi:hypothetical protein
MTLFLVTCLIYTTYSYTYCYFSHQSYGPLFDFVLLRLEENIWVQLLLLFFFLSELIAITRTSEYRLSLMEGQWFSGYLSFYFHYILKWNIVENLIISNEKKILELCPFFHFMTRVYCFLRKLFLGDINILWCMSTTWEYYIVIELS